MRVFARVVEKGSFTEAARSLRLPKSSVSKSVRALEAALGIQLVQRTSRSVRPTDAGTHLYEAVRPALGVIDDAVTATAAQGAEPRGRVRISCPPDLDELVAAYVAKFRRRHPHVRVEVSLGTRAVDLVAEGFDLALRGGELRDSTLTARAVLRTELGLFASPSYLEEHAAPRRAADLHDHACIGVNVTHARALWKLTGRDGPEHVTVSCALVADDTRFAAQLATQGAGIALLPSLTARPLVSARKVVRVLPRLGVRDVSLRLISPRRGLEPMAVRLFREGLLRESWAKD